MFNLAVVQEDPKAQLCLALLHLHGEGGPKDDKEANRLLLISAKQGHDDAKLVLDCLQAKARHEPIWTFSYYVTRL